MIRNFFAAFSVSAVLVATAAHAEDVTKTFDAAQVKRLNVENGNGTVDIRGSDAKVATVVAHKIRFDDSCKLSIDLKGDALVVANKEAARDPGKSCAVKLELTVPRQLDVGLLVGSGDVTLVGVRGKLDYKLGSGNLTVKDADLADLNGRSGSGDVNVTGTLADADLKIGAGNATITLNKTPAKGHLDVKVGTGSAVVKLPKDSRIKSSFKAGIGSLTNEFKDDPNAPFTISGSAGTGDMSIRRF